MENFTKLGLSSEVTDVLKQSGFKEPSEIQEKAIPVALAGKDIIGGSATGSGKTLAFASPIIENIKPNNHVQAIILTPTRELAEQVATSVRYFGKNKKLNILPIYGGVSIGPQVSKLTKTDVVVGTPGRILDHIGRGTLKLENIKVLVLDEVDRMLDMGFRKDVERIINECPKERQTMMFSATISNALDYLSKKHTKDPVEIAVESHVDPSKLKQVYYDVPDNKKFSLLISLLKQEESDLVMVFCNTRRIVDFIAQNLIKSGVHAKAIHGKIEQKKRIKILEEFHKKGLGILVCTDVAARGLDIKGVSHVYNYDIPDEPNDYVHRIGRTARAGKEGKAITILASRDYEKFGNLLQLEGINIEPKDLPQLEIVKLKMTYERNNGRFNRGNRRNGGGSRGGSYSRSSGGGSSSYGRSSGSSSYGRSSSGGSRGSSYGRSSSGGSRGSSYGRSSGGRSSSYGRSSSSYGRKPSYGRSSGGSSRGGSSSYGRSSGSRGGSSSYGRSSGSRGGSSSGSYGRSSGSRGGSYGGSSGGSSRGGSYGRSSGGKSSSYSKGSSSRNSNRSRR